MSTKAFKRGRLGFSLVELVIVIVIIGILAAIAIPRVSRGSRGAGESALVGNLAVLRNAIELYASEHNGNYPGHTGSDPDSNAADTQGLFISHLTMYTDADGNAQATRDATHQYGPYLRKGIPPAPVGTNRGSSDVLIDKTNSPPSVVTAGGEGWAYNPITGDIIVNADDQNEAQTDTYNNY